MFSFCYAHVLQINPLLHIFSGTPVVSWRNKPTWDVGRTLEKLVNHSPAARDTIYKLFSCSPNIPRGFITPGNPQKMRSIVRCSRSITRKFISFDYSFVLSLN